MRLKPFIIVLSLAFLFTSCRDEDTGDPLPEDIIDFPTLVSDWDWQHTINTLSNDTLTPFGSQNVTYTYTQNGVFYSTEDGRRGQSYVYYVTAETRQFEGQTCNKMYLYISGNKVFENYFYLPVANALIIYDGQDYYAKGTFLKVD